MQREKPSAFGGILISSLWIESRRITGHRLGSPVCSYLHSREMLVELDQSFPVVVEFASYVEILYFFQNYAFVIWASFILFCILPWLQKQPQEQTL